MRKTHDRIIKIIKPYIEGKETINMVDLYDYYLENGGKTSRQALTKIFKIKYNYKRIGNKWESLYRRI